MEWWQKENIYDCDSWPFHLTNEGKTCNGGEQGLEDLFKFYMVMLFVNFTSCCCFSVCIIVLFRSCLSSFIHFSSQPIPSLVNIDISVAFFLKCIKAPSPHNWKHTSSHNIDLFKYMYCGSAFPTHAVTLSKLLQFQLKEVTQTSSTDRKRIAVYSLVKIDSALQLTWLSIKSNLCTDPCTLECQDMACLDPCLAHGEVHIMSVLHYRCKHVLQ